MAEAVERVLAKIQAKYDELGITDQPFVIVKADAGTYGMGVMSVKSADEVRGLNRKNRNKMAKVKEGLEVSEVIVQEGIYTYETMNGAVCEPVVYMMDRFVIGGFFRVHEGRGADENLNAGGMVFVPAVQQHPHRVAATILKKPPKPANVYLNNGIRSVCRARKKTATWTMNTTASMFTA